MKSSGLENEDGSLVRLGGERSYVLVTRVARFWESGGGNDRGTILGLERPVDDFEVSVVVLCEGHGIRNPFGENSTICEVDNYLGADVLGKIKGRTIIRQDSVFSFKRICVPPASRCSRKRRRPSRTPVGAHDSP